MPSLASTSPTTKSPQSDAFERAREAVLHRSGRGLRKILARSPEVARERSPVGGQTLLISAACLGLHKAVKALLPLCDAQACDATGHNALMFAATTHSLGTDLCMNLLLPLSDLSAANAQGRTILHLAAVRMDGKTARQLIAAGANPVARDQEHQATPLMLAAVHGNADGVRALLDVGDPDAQDKDGWTASMWAIASGLKSDNGLACARLLLPRTDINLRNNDGEDIFQFVESWLGQKGFLLLDFLAAKIESRAIAQMLGEDPATRPNPDSAPPGPDATSTPARGPMRL